MIETRTDETRGADEAPVFLTLRGFVAKHQAFTAGGLRHLLFCDPDGFREACIVRFGRRILIDEGAFFGWLRANRHRTNLFGTPSPKATAKPKGGAKAKGSPRGAR